MVSVSPQLPHTQRMEDKKLLKKEKKTWIGSPGLSGFTPSF